MDPKQRNRLFIGLALFLVPEFLWRPVYNYTYSLLTNKETPALTSDLFSFFDTKWLYISILSVEIIGLILVMFAATKVISTGLKIFLLSLSGVLTVLVVWLLVKLFI